jgi:sugar phosphate isomerase/epimerase
MGICTSVEKAAQVQAAGGDFVEAGVAALLQGQLPDEQWQGRQRVAGLPLPVLAANMLVPKVLKITGPVVDPAALSLHMQRVVSRAQAVGMKTLVFGSGPARQVPEGFDRAQARRQILDFLHLSAGLALKHGICIVVEPLNALECNIINSVAEAMTYVSAVDHPNIRCLVDSYHFWKEKESLDNVRAALPYLAHVHVADLDRRPPGQGSGGDYATFFGLLKRGHYAGPISVECNGLDDIPALAPRVLDFLKRQWQDA